jgi:hypothetical protein
MAGKSGAVKDQFSQFAFLKLSAIAGALIFQKLDLAPGILQGDKKYALIIEKIEYFFSKACLGVTAFENVVEWIEFGMTISPNILAFNEAFPEVLDKKMWIGYRFHNATHAEESPTTAIFPIVSDFTSIGGLLVPADRLYLAAIGAGAGFNGEEITARVWYKTQEITTAEYWELIEARRIIST